MMSMEKNRAAKNGGQLADSHPYGRGSQKLFSVRKITARTNDYTHIQNPSES